MTIVSISSGEDQLLTRWAIRVATAGLALAAILAGGSSAVAIDGPIVGPGGVSVFGGGQGGGQGGQTAPQTGARLQYVYGVEAQNIAASFRNGRGWAFVEVSEGQGGRLVKYQVVTQVRRIVTNNGQVEGLELTTLPETAWIHDPAFNLPTQSGPADLAFRAAGIQKFADQNGSAPLHPTTRNNLTNLMSQIQPTIQQPGVPGAQANPPAYFPPAIAAPRPPVPTYYPPAISAPAPNYYPPAILLPAIAPPGGDEDEEGGGTETTEE